MPYQTKDYPYKEIVRKDQFVKHKQKLNLTNMQCMYGMHSNDDSS